MPKPKIIHAADLFAGAGGTSTGLAQACKQLGYDVDLLAVNHWNVAIASHRENHPWAKHVCASVESLDPRVVVPGGRLDLLVASPECIFFSVARGGRPMEDQRRASAWHILRWLELLRVDNLLVENVSEFAKWGPLNAKGRPIKQREGETFKAWLSAIRSLNYTVDHAVLDAADYGDPTNRSRLFVMAKRGRKPVHWPKPMYSRRGAARGTRPWRTAREDVIDWTLQGQSIFTRKKPLCANTMRRIIEGLERFGGPELQPFIVILRGDDDAGPAPASPGAASGGPTPFLLGQQSGGAPRSVDDPVPTIAAGGAISMVTPFLVGAGGPTRHGEPRSVDEPMPTLLAENHFGVVEPFILPPEGVHRGNAPRSPSEPLQTITQRGGGHVVQPFIVPHFGERQGQAPRTHSIDEPLPAVTGQGAGSLVEPFLTEYYGNGGARSVDEPMPTITTKDRVGLVQPVINGRALDIRFRMLQPHELAKAMGFGDSYKFTGNRREVVRQIGNAVCVQMSRALCTSLLTNTPARVLDVWGPP